KQAKACTPSRWGARSRGFFALLIGCVLLLASTAQAQYRLDHIPDGPPVPMPSPAITQKPNAVVPQDLEFTRSDGVKVHLGDYFKSNRPVVLTLVYFSCPLLCGVNQDKLTEAIIEGPRGLKLGTDYD